MTIEGIINSYQQYGFVGFFRYSFKTMLSKIGVLYGTHNYLVCSINRVSIEELWKARYIHGVKQLSFEDFLLGDRNIFTTEKLDVIKKRYKKGGYTAYGLILNNKLVYSCWVADHEIEIQSKSPFRELALEESLLLDTYCSPNYRGRGIQKAFVAYCLLQISKNEKKHRVIVTTIVENKPSTLSYINSGFRIIFRYKTFSIGHFSWNNFNKHFLKASLS